MKWRRLVGWCRRVGVLAVVVAGGCASPGPVALPVCPGKADVGEALAALAARAENAVSLRVNSRRCLLTYYAPDNNKPERHDVPMKLWFNPPSEVYIQGSIALDAKAVVIGSNAERFWLALRPKEVNSYYEGRWDQVRDFDGLMMSPRVVLEAFGIPVSPDEASSTERWSLENEGPFDILTRHDASGRPTKRVYVHACDYSVRKIEYLDPTGRRVGVAALSEYEPVTEDFSIPTHIEATLPHPDGREDTMQIDLGSPTARQFSPQQRAFMFTPRGRERAERVYLYRDGRWIAER